MSKTDLLERAETSRAYKALGDFDKGITGAFVLLDEMGRYLAAIGHTEQFERWLEKRPAYQELTQLMEEDN